MPGRRDLFGVLAVLMATGALVAYRAWGIEPRAWASLCTDAAAPVACAPRAALLWLQHADAYSLIRGNVIFADAPYLGGYDARNKGVGYSPVPSDAYTVVREDSDPTSATYGRVLGMPLFTLGATTFAGTVSAPGTVSFGTDGLQGRMNIGSGGTPYLDFNNADVRLINDAAGRLTCTKSFGMFGHTGPATQPVTAVTLSDVIAILRGIGACA